MTTSTTTFEEKRFLSAAQKVLELFGCHHPMHYKSITEIALKRELIPGSAETPDLKMLSILNSDIHNSSTQFVRAEPGFFVLREWQKTKLTTKIDKHNSDIRAKLLENLKQLDPRQFEFLVGMLLAEMGFKSTPTNYAKDHGIDVKGTLVIGKIIEMNMSVQVKRYNNQKVNANVVRDVRGSSEDHNLVLIITTSDFTKDAIKEAKEKGKKPVALMNGELLVSLLIENNIGINRISQDVYELEDLN